MGTAQCEFAAFPSVPRERRMEKKAFQAHPKSLASATAMAVLCAAGSASAATPGFYIAGKFGQSSADMDEGSQLRLNALMGSAWSGSQNILMWSETELDK